MSETTTVQIRKKTRDLLQKVGSKGESYDEIILDLLELREAFISDLRSMWEEARNNRKDLMALDEYAKQEGIDLEGS